MHFKKSINQGSFYIQGLRSFKDTLPKNLKKILNKRGYVYSDIINNWSYIVGSNISNVSYPKSFKPNGKKSAGTLIINVQRGNEVDIEYSKTQIINKINSYFGYRLINEIRLRTFSSVNKKEKEKNTLGKFSKKLKKKINEIKSKDIRDSLAQLLDVVKK